MTVTFWRGARKILQVDLNLNFRYQHSLTRFLVKYYKFSRLNFFFFSELRLENVLLKSRFLPDLSAVQSFLLNGLFYVNGRPVLNADLTVFLGDFVQLIVHIKYYIMHKWMLHAFLQLRLRLKNKIHVKMTKKRIMSEDKQRSRSLPKWILNNKTALFDVPSYLEVDYATLSFFLLYEPFNWTDIDPYYFINFRAHVINMYNWKYIT